MHRILKMALTTLVMVATALPVDASSQVEERRDQADCAQSELRPDTATCSADIITRIVESVRSAGSDGSSGGEPRRAYVPFTRIVTGPDGRPCTTTGFREVTDPSIGEGLFRLPEQEVGNILGVYPPCPESPADPARDPATIASRYWEDIPLPHPRPSIAPGWAITGKLAYLETNGQTRYVYTNSTPVGPLEIVATGVYYVDWGDGETTGPHSREGRPWPEGEITHDYIWARTYDIVVEERWTATWSLGGRSGTLRELRTTGRIDDFLAREIQAVVRS